VQNIINPIIIDFFPEPIGIQKIKTITRISNIFGNILLLPVILLFLIELIIVIRKTTHAKQKFLYMLAGIGTPLSIMFLALAGGALPPIRSFYSLPLAFAFMIFFIITHYKKKVAIVVACLALFNATYNAQIVAQLFYSDFIRYNEDVRLAYELDKLIMQTQLGNEKLPVVLVGKYKMASRFQTNFLQGDVIGNSFFEWDNGVFYTTIRGLTFMKSIGINYEMPNEMQLELALKEAISMPAYPNPDCIKRTSNFIVIRISETLYD
jgi:hypothetical protein